MFCLLRTAVSNAFKINCELSVSMVNQNRAYCVNYNYEHFIRANSGSAQFSESPFKRVSWISFKEAKIMNDIMKTPFPYMYVNAHQ